MLFHIWLHKAVEPEGQFAESMTAAWTHCLLFMILIQIDNWWRVPSISPRIQNFLSGSTALWRQTWNQKITLVAASINRSSNNSTLLISLIFKTVYGFAQIVSPNDKFLIRRQLFEALQILPNILKMAITPYFRSFIAIRGRYMQFIPIYNSLCCPVNRNFKTVIENTRWDRGIINSYN